MDPVAGPRRCWTLAPIAGLVGVAVVTVGAVAWGLGGTAGGKTFNEFDPGELARRCGGNVHHAQVIATGLDATREHTLEIEPVFEPGTEQELRLESVCVAGGAARVSE